jgi:hypothetical protein
MDNNKQITEYEKSWIRAVNTGFKSGKALRAKKKKKILFIE